MNWLDSLYSEVNDEFVSNPFPALGETVTVKLRCFSDHTATRFFLRTAINGMNALLPMRRAEAAGRFTYYETTLKVSQPWMSYHFIVETPETYYFFNRREVVTYHPTEDHDWVLIAGFENPDWVPRSVFYQIFPDRFRNGNPENDVRTGQYALSGHETIKMEWSEPAMPYRKAFSLDFYGGDLAGIKEKIPYLKALGVNAVYLNPIFSAGTSHGYDCTDYFHVADHFGGDGALIDLVDELHRNGIRLILDVSINHTGSEHPWFRKAIDDPSSEERGFYYISDDGTYIGWAGLHTLPQLNYSNDRLREIMFRGDDSVVRRYLRPPFGIDGWRFDVGNSTGRKDEHQLSHEVFREVRRAVKKTKPDAYIVGEHWEYNIAYHLGDQWDGAMNYFASGRPLRVFAGEIDHFLEGVAGVGKKRLPGSGKVLADQIMQHYTRLPNCHAYLQFNLLDSHDIHRFHNNREVFSPGIYRGMVIVLFLLPGTPSIYYGDEIGLPGYIEAVEGARYPMEWNEAAWNREFFALYGTLAVLKRTEPALQYGGYRVLFADLETMAFARFTRTRGFIGVISHNRHERTVELPVSLIGGIDGVPASEVFTNEEYPVKDGTIELTLGPNRSALLAIELDG